MSIRVLVLESARVAIVQLGSFPTKGDKIPRVDAALVAEKLSRLAPLIQDNVSRLHESARWKMDFGGKLRGPERGPGSVFASNLFPLLSFPQEWGHRGREWARSCGCRQRTSGSMSHTCKVLR